jgi:hypothetical protein
MSPVFLKRGKIGIEREGFSGPPFSHQGVAHGSRQANSGLFHHHKTASCVMNGVHLQPRLHCSVKHFALVHSSSGMPEFHDKEPPRKSVAASGRRFRQDQPSPSFHEGAFQN